MLGGVVQHVAEHLLQPLRVAGDRLLVQRLVAGILQRDAVLPEQLPVGVDRILQLRLQVGILHLQGEAAVGHLGEIQQLLHHVGQAAGLLEDDLHAPAQLLGVAGLILQQRLAPAVDGRQRRPQLVGHGGDKFRLHFLALADLQGHIVDVVHQHTHLVRVFVGDLDAVAAAGDALGCLRHRRHRRHHVADEDGAGQEDQADDGGHHAADHQHRQGHLTIQLADAGDVAHDAHHLPVVLQQAGGGDDPLAGGLVPAYKVLHRAALHGPGDLRRAGIGTRRQAAGGDLHPPGAVEELQLDAVAVVKGGGVQRGAAVILLVAGHDVGVEVVRTGGSLGPQGGAGAVVVVAGEAHGDEDAHQQQYGGHRDDTPRQPAAAQALYLGQLGGHIPQLLSCVSWRGSRYA